MAGRILHPALAVAAMALLAGCIGSAAEIPALLDGSPPSRACASPGVVFEDARTEAAGFEGEEAFVLGGGCEVQVRLEVDHRVGELAIDIAGRDHALLRYRADGVRAGSEEIAAVDSDRTTAQGKAPAGVYLYRVRASHVAAFAVRVVAS